MSEGKSTNVLGYQTHFTENNEGVVLKSPKIAHS